MLMRVTPRVNETEKSFGNPCWVWGGGGGGGCCAGAKQLQMDTAAVI